MNFNLILTKLLRNATKKLLIKQYALIYPLGYNEFLVNNDDRLWWMEGVKYLGKKRLYCTLSHNYHLDDKVTSPWIVDGQSESYHLLTITLKLKKYFVK